jgi:4-hydroxy-tetrahydrodipicolinate synthase
MLIQGSVVAIITPFQTNGEIDFPSLRALIDMHIEEGTDAIVACGITGEAPTLSDEEKILVIKETVDRVAGRIPVIAGTGTYCTRRSKKLTEAAKLCGADAGLVIIPYYNRPSFEGCKVHFTEVASIGLPVIVYHHPTRTGTGFNPEQLAEICHIPGVCGIKESTGDINFVTAFMKLSKVPLFGGDDTLALPLMTAGAKGIFSIVANVMPRLWHEVTGALLVRDLPKARDLYARVDGLCKSLVLETNPQGVKFALSLLGKCCSAMRLPLIPPQDKTREAIRIEMERLHLVL